MWRNVLGRVAGWDHQPDAPRKRIRGKVHGYRMDLDLSDWSDRWAYFLGRYYETHTQRLFTLALRPGDTFIDIGANIGMTALVAARLVQPGGRLFAFEPNPQAFSRLAAHVELNGLQSVVHIANVGLADKPAELSLYVPRHSGQASFADLTVDLPVNRNLEDVQSLKVPVRVGDEELVSLPDGPLFVKIDVEGFECRVIKGLHRTLLERQPAVVTEADGSMLRRAGDSLESLFTLMHSYGYQAFNVDHSGQRWPGRLLLHQALTASDVKARDLLWLPPSSVFRARLGIPNSC